mgnify:CR=1 FL=1
MTQQKRYAFGLEQPELLRQMLRAARRSRAPASSMAPTAKNTASPGATRPRAERSGCAALPAETSRAVPSASRSPRCSARPPRPSGLGEADGLVEEAARFLGRAGRANGAHDRSVLHRLARRRRTPSHGRSRSRLRARIGFRRSGLSLPYIAIASSYGIRGNGGR